MFFFFKQKTAYEMRISDWSSDVCSSDLDESRPSGWNNLLLPNAAMPHVLWELQGIQRPVYEGGEGAAHVAHLELVTPGKLSPEEYDTFARDLTAFLKYVGEPAALVRESIEIGRAHV